MMMSIMFRIAKYLKRSSSISRQLVVWLKVCPDSATAQTERLKNDCTFDEISTLKNDRTYHVN